MGCGRSRHRSPSQQPDGPYKDKDGVKENGKDAKDGKRGAGGGKKQQKADNKAAKAVIKADSNQQRSGSPRNKASNGKTGDAGGLSGGGGGGGATDNAKKDTHSSSGQGQGQGQRRSWQLEEAIDTPPETAVAVYRSSVPSSARASLKATPPSLHQQDPGTGLGSGPAPADRYSSNNGSLLNGSQKAPATAQEIEMQMEIPEKTLSKDKSSSGNSKPVHITSSQLEFFKMLDEKIEKGPDYNSDDE